MRHPLRVVVLSLVVSCGGLACREPRGTDANRQANNVVAHATPATRPPAAATPPQGVANPDTAMLGEDEQKRHRLFQAAATTRDQTIIREVGRRLGLFNPQNQPTADYRPFVEKHMAWARADADFIRDVNTPQKAREYVGKHK